MLFFSETEVHSRSWPIKAVAQLLAGPALTSTELDHSRKPDEQYALIDACSPGPYLELFARGERPGWTVWGNQADPGYRPTWDTYAYNSAAAE